MARRKRLLLGGCRVGPSAGGPGAGKKRLGGVALQLEVLGCLQASGKLGRAVIATLITELQASGHFFYRYLSTTLKIRGSC